MKTKVAVVVAILAAAVVGLWFLLHHAGFQRTELVPAWQLTEPGAYDAQSIWDPVISWAPDSKSLLLAVSGAGYKQWIVRWKVGDRRLDRVCEGVAPNFVDSDYFLYMIKNPVQILARNLKNGHQRVVVSDVKKLEFWKDISSFNYLPETRTIALRWSNFTRYYEPGALEIDLSGRQIGRIPRTTGEGILDRSLNPSGRTVAELAGELTGGPRTLRIAGKDVATGELGAVAWSPGGRSIAYAEGNEVKLVNSDGLDQTTIARLGSLPIAGPAPYICRLVWSPSGEYLAAIELVPTDEGGYAMVYVLDMGRPAKGR